MRNFVPADWTKNANPRKYDPAVIRTFTVYLVFNFAKFTYKFLNVPKFWGKEYYQINGLINKKLNALSD